MGQEQGGHQNYNHHHNYGPQNFHWNGYGQEYGVREKVSKFFDEFYKDKWP